MRAGRAYVTVRVNSYVPGPMAPMETRNKNASQEVPPNIKVSCKIPLHPILGKLVINGLFVADDLRLVNVRRTCTHR